MSMCEGCGGKGWRFATPGCEITTGPDGWVPLERCDMCNSRPDAEVADEAFAQWGEFACAVAHATHVLVNPASKKGERAE